MVRDFALLWKMFVNSLLQCHHDLSKQKVKTADIQTICSPIDYDFKLRIFSSFSMLLVESWELWTLEPKLWTSQIWTLIHLINTFVIAFVCRKCSKLITLEENIISVQQLPPLHLPLFFAFFSEALNSGIKSCFDGVVFQDAVCEECFSIRLWCLHLKFCQKQSSRGAL